MTPAPRSRRWRPDCSACRRARLRLCRRHRAAGPRRHALRADAAGWPAGRKLSITVIADLHAGGPDMTLPHIRAGRRYRQCACVRSRRPARRLHRARIGSRPSAVPDPVWAAELARLHAPLGTWAILGNHDWWHDLARRARRACGRAHSGPRERCGVAGARRRSNSGSPGSAISLPIGSATAAFAASTTCRARSRKSAPTIPFCCWCTSRIFSPAFRARVALTLAGHTHGGQIRLPLIWPAFVPSKYGARFAYGHVVENDRHLIVSGGLGTSIIPARLGVPPEIVHVAAWRLMPSLYS